MFRHHVVTGRSRLALYLARIPAGLAIIVAMVAIGFTVVCVVCVSPLPPRSVTRAQPLPAQLSEAQLVQWAEQHPSEVVNNFPIRNLPSSAANVLACLPGGPPLAVTGGVDRQGGRTEFRRVHHPPSSSVRDPTR